MEILQAGEKVVFCRYCGQLAGVPTKCPVSYDGRHNFVTRPAGMYICRYCGVPIGRGTPCEVSYDRRHDFVKIDELPEH